MTCATRGGAFPNRTRLPAIIETVYYWCASTKGDCSIGKALEHIANGLGAEAVALSRVRRDAEGVTHAVYFDARHSNTSPRKLHESFASAFLREYLPIARPGTTWFQSAIGVPPEPGLESFQRGRGYGEYGVIPLRVSERYSDLLELHFAGKASDEQRAMANMLAGTLSDAWSDRAKGIFMQEVLAAVPVQQRPVEPAQVLSAENPARLSRSEYRVCVMLSNGVAPSSLCMELAISRSTLRSHLRNIYAKTGVENMPDLLCLLLKEAQAATAGPARIANMVA